jgi:(2S)-methylsuccinyl-CoA dehydrogenase
MRDWANATGRADVANMADAAEGFARAALFGRSAEERVLADKALAGIASNAIPSQDLGATDEHRMLRSVLREFVETKIRPIAQQVHRDDLDVPEAVIGGVAALGLFGISIPETYGGSQEARADSRTVLIATEELSRGSLGIGGSLITRPEILVRALIKGGTEEQKRRWLPPIAAGSQMVAVAVTEPDRG